MSEREGGTRRKEGKGGAHMKKKNGTNLRSSTINHLGAQTNIRVSNLSCFLHTFFC